MLCLENTKSLGLVKQCRRLTCYKRYRNLLSKAKIERNILGFPICTNANKVFPYEWISRNVFVFLDFKGEDSLDEPLFDPLICIIPTIIRNNVYAYILKIERKDFVAGIYDNSLVLNLNKYAYDVNIKTMQLHQKIAKTTTVPRSHPPIRRKFRF